METQKPTSKVPAAIVIAGLIIAGAILWQKKPVAGNIPPAQQQAAATGEINIRAISSDDHILGNPNAPIKIVEYSDPSCPFCKMFNPVMEQVMDQYGASGKVAWIYRHFPLDKPDQNGNVLHKNAGHEAQAMECAAVVGDNDRFWAFEKRLYEVTPSVTPQTPNGLDQSQLPEIAKYVGLNVDDFNSCLSSEKTKSAVEADYTDGLNAGISGTPYSILITPSGTKIPLVGMKDFATLKSGIDALLSDKNQ
ncbi:MAG: DsbA family protein [Patescibacteria group bacterium]|nr:DsbA family protein [Patescibacteria group bacterium]